MNSHTTLIFRAFFLGVLLTAALVAFSVLLEPEYKKYAMLVSNLTDHLLVSIGTQT